MALLIRRRTFLQAAGALSLSAAARPLLGKSDGWQRNEMGLFRYVPQLDRDFETSYGGYQRILLPDKGGWQVYPELGQATNRKQLEFPCCRSKTGTWRVTHLKMFRDGTEIANLPLMLPLVVRPNVTPTFAPGSITVRVIDLTDEAVRRCTGLDVGRMYR